MFFDYNGNGVRDSGEPLIAGASIQAGGISAETGNDGAYALEGLAAGKYQVKVSAPGFRYLSLSTSAFQPTDQPASISIAGNVRRDWALMQGFLTAPLETIDPWYFYDRDPEAGRVRWWNGTEYHSPRGPYSDDGHAGTDFRGVDGQVVFAAAPGVVPSNGIQNIDVNGVPQYSIGIQHMNCERCPSFSLGPLLTSYNHIKTPLVKPGQRVSRGEPIGILYVGQSEAHVHVNMSLEVPARQLQLFPDAYGGQADGLWGRAFGPNELAWITDRDFLWLMQIGWWTVHNAPVVAGGH